MNLTRAEKEQLENAGIQCIQVSGNSPIEQALEENVRRFNEIKESIETSLDSLIRDLVDLNNALEHAMRGKVMVGMKSDCDVSYYEAEYLVSKGWNPEIFKDY